MKPSGEIPGAFFVYNPAGYVSDGPFSLNAVQCSNKSEGTLPATYIAGIKIKGCFCRQPFFVGLACYLIESCAVNNWSLSLSGENGIIDLLRKEGYTVKPL